MSPPCQNQGYVLDGYPKTLEQAQSLFGGKLEKKNSIFILHSYFFLASGEEGKTQKKFQNSKYFFLISRRRRC